MKPSIVALVGALLISTAAVVRGDPITITSGSATVGLGGDPLLFSFAGDDFAATGRWSAPFVVPFFTCSHGCLPGQLITLSSTMQNLVVGVVPDELVAAGSAMVDGTFYPFVEFIGTLGLLTPSITIPPPDLSGGATVIAPFSFGGVLQGWDPLTRDGELRFTKELNGSGEATLKLAPSLSSYTFGTLSYSFSSPAAVTPEPATLLLLGTGVIGILVRRRRHR